MARKKHRNLFRERVDADARRREQSGMAPLTHEEWAEFINGKRPTIGGKRVGKVSDSSISRALSGTPGVARRIGIDRAWILTLFGIDYAEYIALWGRGPEGGDRETLHRRRAKGDRAYGGRTAME